eukprot:15440691-Alexandrium_andersonii.AAC.1
MVPGDLLQAGFARAACCTLVAAEGGQPTCFPGTGEAKCLDYFAVGTRDFIVEESVKRMADSPLATHWPVTLHLRDPTQPVLADVLVRPRLLPEPTAEHRHSEAARVVERDMHEQAALWTSGEATAQAAWR